MEWFGTSTRFRGRTLDLLVTSSSHDLLSNLVINELTHSNRHPTSSNIIPHHPTSFHIIPHHPFIIPHHPTSSNIIHSSSIHHPTSSHIIQHHSTSSNIIPHHPTLFQHYSTSSNISAEAPQPSTQSQLDKHYYCQPILQQPAFQRGDTSQEMLQMHICVVAKEPMLPNKLTNLQRRLPGWPSSIPGRLP